MWIIDGLKWDIRLKVWTKWENVISVTRPQHPQDPFHKMGINLFSCGSLSKVVQHLWPSLPHSLHSKKVTHNCSEKVATIMTWFWWEATTLNIFFLSPNSSLNFSLLQYYTIFHEISEFGRAKTCSKIVSIINQTPMTRGNSLS